MTFVFQSTCMVTPFADSDRGLRFPSSPAAGSLGSVIEWGGLAFSLLFLFDFLLSVCTNSPKSDFTHNSIWLPPSTLSIIDVLHLNHVVLIRKPLIQNLNIQKLTLIAPGVAINRQSGRCEPSSQKLHDNLADFLLYLHLIRI